MALFDGKTVIITGAARGLGRDYARLFAADGANVVVADLNAEGAEDTAAEIRKDGQSAIAVPVDITKEESAAAMAAAALAEFGRIDILINNAGIWGDYELVGCTFVELDYWRFVIDVNLTGALICSRAVMGAMQEQEWGRIVNITSIGAYMAMSGAYGVSKAALNALTFQLANELGFANITVNSLAPGNVRNEATLKQIPEEMYDHLVSTQLIQRPNLPSDLYGAMKWLCSDDGEMVTAQWISPNGGIVSRIP